MGALSYLVAMQTKNRFLKFVRSPGKVIYAVVLFFAAVMSFVSSDLPSHSQLRDVRELYVILLAFYTFAFINIAKNGFMGGGSLFSLADINLLFTSPVRNTSVLLYAMLQQLGRSLFVGVILLLQFNNVNNYYGVGYGEFLLMVLFYGITVFFSQLVSVMIYTLCNGNEKRTAVVKTLCYLVVGLFAVCGIVGSYDSGTFTIESAVECFSNDLFLLFPVSGYFVMILQGIMQKKIAFVAVGAVLVILLIVIFAFVVTLRKFDFYEDVLSSAQVNSNTGSVDTNVPPDKKVKVGKTGFTKGWGSSVIYEKNKKENRRASVFYIDTFTVVLAVVNAIMAFTMDSLWGIFAAQIYFVLFSVGSGRWLKELKNPYIYMIPEKSSIKLFYMLKEQLPAYLVQSIVVTVPMSLIIKLSFSEAFGMVLARFGFCWLFTGVNVAMKNIFSSTNKGVFYGFIYIVFCISVSLPSVISAFAMSAIFVFNYEFAFISIFIVNTFIGALLIVLNRKLLDKGIR